MMPVEHHFGRPTGAPAALLARPDEVLEDSALTLAEKRGMLASWVSDANAVPDRPWLRQLENGFQVHVREIVEALKALDGMERGVARSGRKPSPDEDDDPPPSPIGALPPRGGGPGDPLMEGAAELAAA